MRITKPELDLYDAAIDSYDPRMKAEKLSTIFADLKRELTPLIKRISDKVAERPDIHAIPDALKGGPLWDPAKQAAMCREIAEAIGFDFSRGRMDVSVHPFTGGSHPTDVRITTRYSAANWIEGITGTIHECGHAMYEQGRAAAGPDAADLPAGESLGMATHESQSLLWERMVGQSLPFWRWAAPVVHRHFPHTRGCTPEDFYRAINQVEPSLIRVDADEVTYPLHVILRFELERDLFAGRAAVGDLPRRWGEAMGAYLGVAVPSDRDGVLQDVHWAAGALGYFPSYTLGAVMAAQLYDAARRELPGLEDRIAAGAGGFAELRGWLNARVHRLGSVHPSADDLLRAVTGSGLRPDAFVGYLRDKYSALYGL